jgi:hypothetical protein
MSMKPAIRNWQSQPPTGGWAIEYTLPGTDQKWLFQGLPHSIVEGIAEVQGANGIFKGYGPVWDMANAIWTKRDPKRALSYTESTGDRITSSSPAPLSRSTTRARVTKPCARC